MLLRALLLPSLLLVLMLGGCKDRSGAAPKPVASTVDSGTPPAEEPLPFKAPGSHLAGTLDVRNRHVATVLIETPTLMEAGIDGQCSGVLIGPQVILTAGHCVCTKQSCASRADVTTLFYDPPRGGSESMPGYKSRTYTGNEVRPHPQFKLLLDEQERADDASADLAVILLEEPVGVAFSPIALADRDVHAGETFVMAGYTYDKIVGGISGQRRFSRYQIEELMPPGDERALFKQPGRELYRGDSGGPCLREGPQELVLVGISSRGLGKSPTFTRTYPYRDWLASELKRAARLHRAESPNDSAVPIQQGGNP
jgi:hypothetical protein